MPQRTRPLTARILRLADVQAAPWKNGGGTTRTLAVHPPEAGIDAFDWRISVADVTADGPFSPFPGVDRVLVLLAGAGMDLVPTDGCSTTIALEEPGDLARFPGERPVSGVLRAGPTRDLNVMVRRDRGSVRVQVLDAPASGSWSLVVAVAGAPTVAGHLLEPGDLAWAPGAVGGTGRFAAVDLPGSTPG